MHFNGPIVDLRGGKENVSRDSAAYTMDINGEITKTAGKPVTLNYAEFRKVVPLVLTRKT